MHVFITLGSKKEIFKVLMITVLIFIAEQTLYPLKYYFCNARVAGLGIILSSKDFGCTVLNEALSCKTLGVHASYPALHIY